MNVKKTGNKTNVIRSLQLIVALLIVIMPGLAMSCVTPSDVSATLQSPDDQSSTTRPLWLQNKPGLPVFKLSVDSQERRILMADYAQRHYGTRDFHLETVQSIIIHTTAIQGFRTSFAAFRDSRLDPAWRADIAAGGEVNVGVHFLIAPDGTIAQLLPLDCMGRHAVGYNHLSFGIELAARRNSDITREQIASTANLVHALAGDFPSIRYVFGHHEYMNKTLSHFILFKDLDTSYSPPVKVDPGAKIMAEIRKFLREKWNRTFLD